MQQTAIMKRRQTRRCRRRLSPERLEDAHMKHIMNAGTLRKLKPVSNGSNALGDLERPGVPRAELPAETRHQ
jgi:hypothetical protein